MSRLSEYKKEYEKKLEAKFWQTHRAEIIQLVTAMASNPDVTGKANWDDIIEEAGRTIGKIVARGEPM